MDKRTDIDRPNDTATTRDRVGMGATYGDPDAVPSAPFTDDTAPNREGVAFESTRTATSTYDRSRDTNDSGNRQRTPEEIERDIEHTRAEMSETIDEIEERLSPRYIKQEIKDSINESIDSARERLHPSQLAHAGKRAGRNMFEAIKENPLPAVITGLGLAWWMKSASEQGGNDFRTEYATRYPRGSRRGYMESERYYRGGPSYYEDELYYDESMPYSRGYEYYEPSYESGSMTSQVREKAGQMKHQASDMAHDVADRASDMAHRVGDRASHFARGVQRRADSPIEAIRENPLPAILIGAGIAWWMKSASDQGSSDFRSGYSSYPRAQSQYGYYDEDVYYPGVGSEDESGSVSDRARELKHQASDKAHEISDRAEEMAHQAQRQVRRAGRQVQYRARRTTNWLDDMMHENPLATGALMLGVGALVGLALPGTRKEDELMGPTRDHLMDEAVDMAHGLTERAQGVADHATHEVKQSVRDVAKEVVKDVVKDATRAVKSEAKEHFSGSGKADSSSSATHSSTSTSSTTSGTTTGGSTSGSTGLEGSTSGAGPQADRNKSGSNL